MLPAHSAGAQAARRPSAAESRSGTVTILLGGVLAFYALGRLSQLFAPSLPPLVIVLLHVIPPALFAVIHGTRLYGLRGFLGFATCCLTIGTIFESLSLGTGFPFGHYVFTSVMGPKIVGLPFLLVLAYLGIGYPSWVVALLIVRDSPESPRIHRLLIQPAFAAVIMTCWDLTMDPDWATVDRAWIWRDGGVWFGVPISNYLGWLITTFTFYVLFAWFAGKRPAPSAHAQRFWRAAVALYAICALGNLVIPFQPMAPSIVADATGKLWQTSHILFACSLCSLVAMLPWAIVAWFRTSSMDGRGASGLDLRGAAN